MQQVRDRAVSTRLPRAIPASPAQARSVSHGDATYELRVQKGPSHDATRRRMAQKSPYRAESAVLLRGAAGTSGAQKLVTRPTGRPEGGTTATGGAQRAGIALAAFSMPSGQRPMGAGAVCFCHFVSTGERRRSRLSVCLVTSSSPSRDTDSPKRWGGIKSRLSRPSTMPSAQQQDKEMTPGKGNARSGSITRRPN